MKTCKERIDENLKHRLEEMREILEIEDPDKAIDRIDGISLAYSDDQHYRAKNWLLSTGGPEDGFRFFEDGTIEYYFKDWFDGAVRELYGEEKQIMEEIYSRFFGF